VSDHDIISKAINLIAHHEGEAARHLAEATRWKNFVNDHDRLAEREPRYPDVGTAIPSESPLPAAITARPNGRQQWAPGEFYGKPLAAAARTILQARFKAAGNPMPAAVDEIHVELVQGNYDFGTSNADQQKQGIRISLGKNSPVFVKLPNTDLFGLVEWYGKRQRVVRPRNGSGDLAAPASPDEGESEEAAGESPAATEAMHAEEDK
jgi:hypothetical protein